MSLQWLRTLRTIATACLLVEIGIHMAMTPDHLGEKFYIGVLFVIGTGVLCLAVLGLGLPGPVRSWSWVLGSAVCVVMFGLFIASRTVGLPAGYLEGWFTDYALGVVSLPFEVIFVACAAACLRLHWASPAADVLRSAVRDRESDLAPASSAPAT
jgi:hypothetical protein